MFICARYCLVSLILPGWSAWLILIWSLWFDQLALSVLLCPPHKMLDTNYSLCPHIAYEGGTCERYWQQAFSPWGFCCHPVAFCSKGKEIIFTHHEVFLPCVKVEKIVLNPPKISQIDKRDHPYHSAPMLAGMWGAARDSSEEFKSFQQSLKGLFEEVIQHWFSLWYWQKKDMTELQLLKASITACLSMKSFTI